MQVWLSLVHSKDGLASITMTLICCMVRKTENRHVMLLLCTEPITYYGQPIVIGLGLQNTMQIKQWL